MSKKDFVISSAGLKNIVFTSKIGMTISDSRSKYETISNLSDNNFRFIFGRKEVQMNSFFADFISPRVSHIHQVDPTVESIEIIPQKYYNDEMYTESVLENFKRISSGYSIEVDEEMCSKLRELSIFLDNEELYNQMNALFPLELSIDQIDSILNQLQAKYDRKNDQFLKFDDKSLVDFVSKNFDSISKEKFVNLSKSIFYSIISNDNLKASSEDSLFDSINNFFNEKEYENEENENSHLNKILFYEIIDIKKLSETKLQEYLYNINSEEMTQELWYKICKLKQKKQIQIQIQK